MSDDAGAQGASAVAVVRGCEGEVGAATMGALVAVAGTVAAVVASVCTLHTRGRMGYRIQIVPAAQSGSGDTMGCRHSAIGLRRAGHSGTCGTRRAS